MGILAHKNIFAQNNKTRRFYNTKISRSTVFYSPIGQFLWNISQYFTLEHNFYKRYSTVEHEFRKFTTTIKLLHSIVVAAYIAMYWRRQLCYWLEQKQEFACLHLTLLLLTTYNSVYRTVSFKISTLLVSFQRKGTNQSLIAEHRTLQSVSLLLTNPSLTTSRVSFSTSGNKFGWM